MTKRPGPKTEEPIRLSRPNDGPAVTRCSSGSMDASRGAFAPPGEKKCKKGDGMKGWIVFLIGLLFFGCASTKDLQILDREIDRLQSEINALKKESNSNRDQISELKAA